MSSVSVAALAYTSNFELSSENLSLFTEFDIQVPKTHIIFYIQTCLVCLWLWYLVNLLHALIFKLHHWLKFIIFYGITGAYLLLSTKFTLLLI